MPRHKSVALDAHCWEAFIGPSLGQAQNGRFCTEFGDPRNDLRMVRMQDGEIFVTKSAWLSRGPIAAVSERGPRRRLRLPSSTASASVNDHSLRTEVGGGSGYTWKRWKCFRNSQAGQCGQRRCFVKSGPGCEASPTRTAVLGATLRDVLRRSHVVLILPLRPAATARKLARRYLESVVSCRERATTHADTPDRLRSHRDGSDQPGASSRVRGGGDSPRRMSL